MPSDLSSTDSSDSTLSTDTDEEWVVEVILTESQELWGPESRSGMRVKRLYEREYVEWKLVRSDGLVRLRRYRWGQWKLKGIVGVWLRHLFIPPWEI
jgi:hypothetical protein